MDLRPARRRHDGAAVPAPGHPPPAIRMRPTRTGSNSSPSFPRARHSSKRTHERERGTLDAVGATRARVVLSAPRANFALLYSASSGRARDPAKRTSRARASALFRLAASLADELRAVFVRFFVTCSISPPLDVGADPSSGKNVEARVPRLSASDIGACVDGRSPRCDDASSTITSDSSIPPVQHVVSAVVELKAKPPEVGFRREVRPFAIEGSFGYEVVGACVASRRRSRRRAETAPSRDFNADATTKLNAALTSRRWNSSWINHRGVPRTHRGTRSWLNSPRTSNRRLARLSSPSGYRTLGRRFEEPG